MIRGRNKYVRFKEVDEFDMKRHMLPLLIFLA